MAIPESPAIRPVSSVFRRSPAWPVRAFFLILALLLARYGQCEENHSEIETQVLRVVSTKYAGYYHKPWKAPDFVTTKSSGFFFEDEKNFPGRRGLILTNAHAVSMAQSIQVSNGREKRQYKVTPLGICNSADFAILEMSDEELESYERINGPINPLQLGDSDALRVGDKVTGWGYPLGGESLSKSEQGEISRIEVSRYSYSLDRWLMIQASLQQNRGNSGGPVLKDGKVVGIAFQGMRISDRINYFIPINLVKNLIPLLDKQHLIPSWLYVVQRLFPRLKEYYGLSRDQGGVLLDYIIPDGGPYRFGLRTHDILLAIDDLEIDNYGEIYFEPLGQKIHFSEALNRKKVGDPLHIKVLRQGQVLDIKGTVTPGLPRLVPRIFSRPNYFIFSGIGFVELTLNCIDNLGKSGDAFRAKYADGLPSRPHEKIVIISEVFPEYGLSESAAYLRRVEKINETRVLNAKSLYTELIEHKKRGESRALLTLEGHLVLPLDLQNASTLDAEIQHKYGILYMMTPGGLHN
ncbi:MAG: trypsin-like peptidase domain-containing protein [Desulfomonilaceae bacterium]